MGGVATEHLENPKSEDFHLKWDKIGMILSILCAIHCVLTPFVLLSLPILARYYLVHPYFHILLAFLIIPVGTLAFYTGFKHHHKKIVYVLGIPGLFLVGLGPIVLHQLRFEELEPIVMVVGSTMLVSAHYINLKACRHCKH